MLTKSSPLTAKSSCGCSGSTKVGRMRERMGPSVPVRRVRQQPREMREQPRVREHVEAKIPADATPVVMGKCRPFLKIEKDPEKFAACNALADKIGEIDDAKKAAEVVYEAIGNEVNEVFGLLTLDLHKRLKSVVEIGRGEPSSVMAPIGATCQMACADGAHSVILFHVHPSGVEAEPSEADRETTKAFEAAFQALEINLLDHIIVGGDAKNPSYYSFEENGELTPTEEEDDDE